MIGFVVSMAVLGLLLYDLVFRLAKLIFRLAKVEAKLSYLDTKPLDFRMTLNEAAKRAHETARAKGFWDGDAGDVCKKLLLIHAEVSEAAECHRANILGAATELADVLIRTLDLLYHMQVDVDKVVMDKMTYNDTREKLHGKKF